MWTSPKILKANQRRLQCKCPRGTSNIFNKNHQIEFDGNTLETSTPDNITRLATSASRKPIGKSLSLLAEDRFDINGAANILEWKVQRVGPNDGDVSSRCRTSWRGRVEHKTKSRHTADGLSCRGDLASPRKRAQVSKRHRDEALHLRSEPTWRKLKCRMLLVCSRWWQAWCPCCRRPTEVSAYVGNETEPPKSVAPLCRWHTHASSLWSASPGFVLGAPVRGRALRRSGTKHDLVLMHTDNVPLNSQTAGAHVNLFHSKGNRFHRCFKKWLTSPKAWNNMILMLDIDVAILRCPDESFELPAPAAMRRDVTCQKHGTKVKDRYCFAAVLSHNQFVRRFAGRRLLAKTSTSPITLPRAPASCRNDFEVKGHARKDCLKFSAWLVGYQRCKSELRASESEKLECAPD